MSAVTFEEVTEQKPEKSLVKRLKKTGAGTTRAGSPRATWVVVTRESTGSSISAGTSARSRAQWRASSTIRTGRRTLPCLLPDGEKRYILAPLRVKVGDRIVSSTKVTRR